MDPRDGERLSTPCGRRGEAPGQQPQDQRNIAHHDLHLKRSISETFNAFVTTAEVVSLCGSPVCLTQSTSDLNCEGRGLMSVGRHFTVPDPRAQVPIRLGRCAMDWFRRAIMNRSYLSKKRSVKLQIRLAMSVAVGGGGDGKRMAERARQPRLGIYVNKYCRSFCTTSGSPTKCRWRCRMPRNCSGFITKLTQLHPSSTQVRKRS